eukprot:gnl/Dysnectes_brevis/2130_a2475_905.p1 GENE.gnl/Dysnectes_brevis/2130_a2475_905~~gnl/Dysnectes_brevis/2130_a2475_905.p1  ORF type:complete len:457 (+),score=125.87 gnl/Dysnectes_brevis/2130_a2475_905:30-1373(+)
MTDPLTSEEIDAVVIDFGSSTTKAGHAGDDSPRIVLSSAVTASVEASESKDTAMDGSSGIQNKVTYKGGEEQLLHFKPQKEIKEFMKHGLVDDWDAFEAFFHHLYTDQLRVNPKDLPLLLSQPVFAEPQHRAKLAQIAFEKFEVPALHFADAPVLSCFALGRQGSLVLQAGAGYCAAVPVVDGYALRRHAAVSAGWGGRVLEDVMQMQLRRLQSREGQPPLRPLFTVRRRMGQAAEERVLEGVTGSFAQWHRRQLAADVLKSCSALSIQAIDPLANALELELGQAEPAHVELPDGQVVHLGGERAIVPELLFNPTRLKDLAQPEEWIPEGSTIPGNAPLSLQRLAHQSLRRCPDHLQKDLLGQVLPVGGLCDISGMPQRLRAELEAIEPPAFKVRVAASFLSGLLPRSQAPWAGGSVLASLPLFGYLWVSRREYEESGSVAIERRCS